MEPLSGTFHKENMRVRPPKKNEAKHNYSDITKGITESGYPLLKLEYEKILL